VKKKKQLERKFLNFKGVEDNGMRRFLSSHVEKKKKRTIYKLEVFLLKLGFFKN